MQFHLWVNSRLESAQLDAEICATLMPLAYGHEAYFDLSNDFLLIDTARLAASRARSSGITNANLYMREAAVGTGLKREPIEVEEAPEGQLVVVDGNSTLINAIYSKWPDLPCKLKRGTNCECMEGA
ncbi:hypothetical protein ATU3C_25600 [Agrobacterium genomosp. 3 str. RTP8]|nr:hypothetical protein [Agrobacterium tomkonis RTP8]